MESPLHSMGNFFFFFKESQHIWIHKGLGGFHSPFKGLMEVPIKDPLINTDLPLKCEAYWFPWAGACPLNPSPVFPGLANRQGHRPKGYTFQLVVVAPLDTDLPEKTRTQRFAQTCLWWKTIEKRPLQVHRGLSGDQLQMNSNGGPLFPRPAVNASWPITHQHSVGPQGLSQKLEARAAPTVGSSYDYTTSDGQSCVCHSNNKRHRPLLASPCNTHTPTVCVYLDNKTTPWAFPLWGSRAVDSLLYLSTRVITSRQDHGLYFPTAGVAAEVGLPSKRV